MTQRVHRPRFGHLPPAFPRLHCRASSWPPSLLPAPADAHRSACAIPARTQDDDNMKEALRYSAALLGELRTSLLR